MRILVVGAGSIGRRHIGTLLALGCEVLVYDVSADARAEAVRLGAKDATEPQTVEPAKAVVIATPWSTHLQVVERLFDRSSMNHRPPAFFVEKPLGTLDEAHRWRELVAECEQRQIVTQCGFMHRFHPAVAALKSVASPLIGRFTCDATMRTWPAKSYGPALLELSHELDLALWCGAPDQRVSVDVAEEYRSVFSLCGNGQRWRLSLNGQAERYDRRWYVANDVMHVEVALSHTNASNPDALYRAEMEHFLNAVRTGKQSEPAATLADGLRVLEVCQKVTAQIGAHA